MSCDCSCLNFAIGTCYLNINLQDKVEPFAATDLSDDLRVDCFTIATHLDLQAPHVGQGLRRTGC